MLIKKENLKEAMTVESYEAENLFPELLDTAKSENNRLADSSTNPK
jgi:rubrerythrin